MSLSRFRVRRGSRQALVAAACLVAPLVVVTSSPAVAATQAVEQQAAVPTLDWQPCGLEVPGFECATATVPLDHDRPLGATIDLALSRIPATDPARRIGSLFLNPGGPGGPGVSFVQRRGTTLYSDEVRARFDLVGFDPRGVAGSTPLLCFDSFEQAGKAFAPFPFPFTRQEERAWRKADLRFAQACVERAGAIIDHMSTANVARDMDLLRQAVGDEQMTFAGYSYGSYVGSTYANLFPDRVRAVIIDGVIDPIADATGRDEEWRTLPVDARLESEQGAYETLRELLRLCDEGGETCAFSDGDPTSRYDALAVRLQQAPAVLPDGEGGTTTVTYNDLVSITLGALYSPARWPALAEFLQEVDTASGSQRSRAALAELREPVRAEEPYSQTAEGFYGVWCTDSLNPDSFADWVKAAREADARYPYFGRAWIWGSSICRAWPGQDDDRYLGPFDVPTANPVLVVGTRFDPATRYQDAVTTSQILASARLLTVEGWGHTSLGLSTCADGYASAYLLAGALPAAGTACPVDRIPFAKDANAAAAAIMAAPESLWGPPSRRAAPLR